MEWPAHLSAHSRVHLRLALAFVLPLAAAAAAPTTFSSGSTRTHLIELYTSEGCSSCPPAEEWLGPLRDDPRLWHDFVPVEFHVAYWDRLGWPDRFASQEFTAREYDYAKGWGSSTVYTPCFVLDGGEWSSASGREAPGRSAERAGVLTATYGEGGRLRANFAGARNATWELHAAVLGGGIVSEVRAGENEGRTLHHEFVVLVLRNAPLKGGAAELLLPTPKIPGVRRRALAIWVTRRGELAPVQATGGWLQ